MAGTRNSGRKRKPSELKRVEGNRSKLGRDKIRDDVRGRGLPACPAYLTSEHRRKWASVIAALPAGILTRADTAILESFVVSWQLTEDSAIAILKSDKLVRGPNGTAVHNPHLSILFRSQRELRAAGAELGLSPSARARLVATPDFSDDPMRLLMGDGDDPAAPWSTN